MTRMSTTLDELCESAESILRGDTPRGPLSGIGEPAARRVVAMELMNFPVGRSLEVLWLPQVDALTPSDARWTLPDDLRCPCGTPWRAHADAESDEPMCLHLYADSLPLAIEQRRYRRQALAAFATLLPAVVATAYSNAAASRVSAAWAVIDAVDRGDPLVPALARALHVGEAAVRKGRWIPASPYTLPHARRLVRALGCLTMSVSDAARRWPRLWQSLPVIDLVARSTGRGTHALLDSAADEVVGRLWQGAPSRRERCRRLRHVIRRLREKPEQSASACLEEGWRPGLIRQRKKRKEREPSTTILRLSEGWSARQLVTRTALANEGAEMRHCVGSYGEQVEAADIQVFSLVSENRGERATLSIDPPLTSTGSDLNVTLTIAGPANQPVSLSALQAAIELLRHFRPEGVRVSFL